MGNYIEFELIRNTNIHIHSVLLVEKWLQIATETFSCPVI